MIELGSEWSRLRRERTRGVGKCVDGLMEEGGSGGLSHGFLWEESDLFLSGKGFCCGD